MNNQKRKRFTFHHSYYEILNELSKEEQHEFLMALLNKEFKNIEPSHLSKMANLAYNISQIKKL
jgi:hypothetical protein